MHARRLPGVVVRSTTQLLPELAAELGGWRRVVLVDARPADSGGVVVRPLTADGSPDGVTTHHMDPRGLVGLAGVLGIAVGEVVLVTVPAADLSLGTGLSPATAAAVDEAVAVVADLCRDAGATSGTA